MLSLIRGTLLRLLPALPSPWLLLAIITAAGGLFFSGFWTGVRVVKGGEVVALQKTLEERQAFHDYALELERKRVTRKLARVSERVIVKEVMRDVKDDANCDVPPAVAGLLDLRLQGHPLGGAGNSTPAPRLEGISQSQSLNALDYCAEQFYNSRDYLIELNLKYEGCEVRCERTH